MSTVDKTSLGLALGVIFLGILFFTIVNEISYSGCLSKEFKRPIEARNFTFLEAKELQQETVSNIAKCMGLYDQN